MTKYWFYGGRLQVSRIASNAAAKLMSQGMSFNLIWWILILVQRFRFRFKVFISRSETCSPAKGTKFNIKIFRGQMKPDNQFLLPCCSSGWEKICPIQKKWRESNSFWSVNFLNYAKSSHGKGDKDFFYLHFSSLFLCQNSKCPYVYVSS